MTRAKRIDAIRIQHAAHHAYCKTVLGPHERPQRVCKDPCHRAKRS